MKRILSYLFVLQIFCFGNNVIAQKNFGNTIYIPADLPDGVRESVDDMAHWLQKTTGIKYGIKTGNKNETGIRIMWANQTDLAKSQFQLINKDGQSFYLCIKEASCATIVGTGKNSFNNGIYTFLHELGFRWYMPGDAWAIVPKEIPQKLQIDKVYTPDFQGRFYAGTGGVNAIAGTDPKNTFKQDFNTWNKRNRYSTDYAIKGHSGHLFYNANKKILDAHPEWFCNNKINRYGRMDISHPEVVKLFTDWALAQVKPGDAFPTIGVDPSDGAGGKDDCLPINMPGIKSWSDKYFWLANKVAERLDKKDTKTQVQLYAYANHAATPSFTLHKNVYPIIIPYAFQRLSSPADFIKEWSAKINGRPMGMYDYWNITQWSSGIPQFNIYSIPEKLRLWKQYKVTSINLESTNGKGAMGHVLWLASQMMWNTQLSFDSLYNDFLSQSFGPSAPDVKKMYDRWSTNYQNEMEVDLSLQNLADASSKTDDQAIHTRLNELKAYVHYLKLFYDYQANSKSIKAFEELVNYIHSIHHLRLLQSSAILERYIKAPAGYKKADTRQLPANEKIIEDQFQRNRKEHITSYLISKFEFDIRAVKPLEHLPEISPKHINGRNNYQFYIPSTKEINIQAGSTLETRLTITDSDQKTVYEKDIPASKEGFTSVKLKLAPGEYSMSFGDFARFSRLKFPSDIVFMSNGISYYDNASYPIHYLYVPKNVDAIVYQDNLGPGTNKRGFWLTPDGERVDPIKVKNKIYQVPVPVKYRGKVWTLNIGHRQFEMLNIPNRFSIRKFVYKED